MIRNLFWIFISVILSSFKGLLLVEGDEGKDVKNKSNLNIILVLADAWRYSAFGNAEDPDGLAMTPRLDGQ